jgi:hypothetical protein
VLLNASPSGECPGEGFRHQLGISSAVEGEVYICLLEGKSRPESSSIEIMPAIQHPVKINVDLGEGYGNFKCGPDDELIPLIDHANVACGFHAGFVLASNMS